MNVSDIERCRLAPWMETIINYLPRNLGRTAPAPVLMDPLNGRYVFGCCNLPLEKSDHFLWMFHRWKHPILMKIYPKTLRFLHNEAILEKYMGKGHHEWEREAFSLEDLRRFAVNDQYQALYTVAQFIEKEGKDRGLYNGHVRTIVKDVTNRRLVLLDPHGTTKSALMDDHVFFPRVNRFLSENREIPFDELVIGTQHADQAYSEGSCGAVSYMRMLYMVYMSHMDPSRAPISFKDERVPCVFAVFVSKLFQILNIINEKSIKQTLEVVGEGLEKRTRQETRRRLIQEEIRSRKEAKKHKKDRTTIIAEFLDSYEYYLTKLNAETFRDRMHRDFVADFPDEPVLSDDEMTNIIEPYFIERGLLVREDDRAYM